MPRCHYCDRVMFKRGSADAFCHPEQVQTDDHVVAKAFGGGRTVLACRRCNGAKGDAPYVLFVAFLKTANLADRQLNRQFRQWVYDLAAAELRRLALAQEDEKK